VLSPQALLLHHMAREYGTPPSHWLLPQASPYLRYWLDQAIWERGRAWKAWVEERALTRLTRQPTKSPPSPRPPRRSRPPAVARARNGRIEFAGPLTWADDAEDWAEPPLTGA
jgi:hypothetical protein